MCAALGEQLGALKALLGAQLPRAAAARRHGHGAAGALLFKGAVRAARADAGSGGLAAAPTDAPPPPPPPEQQPPQQPGPSSLRPLVATITQALAARADALGAEALAAEAEVREACAEIGRWERDDLNCSAAQPPQRSVRSAAAVLGCATGAAAGGGAAAIAEIRRLLVSATQPAESTAAQLAALPPASLQSARMAPPDAAALAAMHPAGCSTGDTGGPRLVEAATAQAAEARRQASEALLARFAQIDAQLDAGRAALRTQYAHVLPALQRADGGAHADDGGARRASSAEGEDVGDVDGKGGGGAHDSSAAYEELIAPGVVASQLAPEPPPEPPAAHARLTGVAGARALEGWPVGEHELVAQLSAQYAGLPRAQLIDRLCTLMPHRTAAELDAHVELSAAALAYQRRLRALGADARRARSRLAEEAATALSALDAAASAAAERAAERTQLEAKRSATHEALGAQRQRRAAEDEQGDLDAAQRSAVESAIAAARAAETAVERQRQRVALAAHRDEMEAAKRAADALAADEAAVAAERHAEMLRVAAERTAFRAAQLAARRVEACARAEAAARAHAEHEAALEGFFERVRPDVEADARRLLQPTAASAAPPDEGGGGAFAPVRGYRDDQLLSDMRHKIFGALVEAGLQHSEYGRKLVLAATPAMPAHLKSAVPFFGNRGYDLSTRHDVFGA